MWSAICATAGFFLLAARTPLSVSANSGVPVQEQWDIDHFCFRRLNKTHQVGCSSSISGNVGVIHLIESNADAKYVIGNGPSNMYVPVIADTDLSVQLLDKFIESKRVAGVIIFRNGSAPTSFSPDDTCPNRYSNYHTDQQSCQWNKHPDNKMTSAFFRDYPFPMFYVKNGTIIGKLRDCFNKFNRQVSNYTTFEKRKCAVKLYSPMNAAVDTVTCLRRSRLSVVITAPKGFCDPLGDNNVVTIVPANRSPEEKGSFANKTMILVARMDTFSMFDNFAPGADTAVTAFDYIGSSRFVYDLIKGKAPYNMTDKNILSLIEFNQLIPENKDKPEWFAYVDNQQYQDNNATKETLDKIMGGLKINNVTKGALPPASAHSFLRLLSSSPSVVITNHRDRYVNKYYNSFFDDDPHRVQNLTELAKNLRVIVEKASNTIFRLAGSNNDESVKVNQTLIEDLLECFLVNASCSLFRSVVNEQSKVLLRKEPLQLYVGVGGVHIQTQIAYLVLASVSGEVVENITDMKSCKLKKDGSEWSFEWMFGPAPTKEQPGICVRHRVLLQAAVSPYFENPDNDDENDYAKYSTWTESVWSASRLELFVQASRRCELVAILSGIVILVVSSVLTFLVYRQADVIFEQASPVAC
ncbi:nicastrin-like isoform X2 [Varroa jacobsoni]|uniref:Nicastrin n=1 Tax=Varroa destructor TaxID=109461 RepID=A0A7M7MIN3_VARDE|nr:nicastrin-like isoform X2 [Varroa destructor]XP_022688036.1 nicastrin-like isoform X2 [Varroa jacobsoni]